MTDRSPRSEVGILHDKELAWETLRTHHDHARAEAALQALDRIYDFLDVASAALAALPVGVREPAEEDMAEGVVAHREPLRPFLGAALGHSVVAGGLDDLAAKNDVAGADPSDGDLNPIADVVKHPPVFTDATEISYATVRCGICGQCVGCECHLADSVIAAIPTNTGMSQ